MKKIIYAFLIVTITNIGHSNSQNTRKKISINNGWYFLDHSLDRGDAYHEDFVQFAKKINLPHSSNITDVYDNVKSYTRGTMLYQKKLQLSKSDLKGKRAYLYFEGVFQVADIYVNRNVVGRHEGGYTAFGYDITNMLTSKDEQIIAVQVNSAQDPYIAPLSIGYALHGGIYRDVWLVITDEVHFDFSEYGDKGIKIRTPKVSKNSSVAQLLGNIINDAKETKQIEVVTVIHDDSGKEIATKKSSHRIAPNQTLAYEHILEIAKTKLWSPDEPYLYSVSSQIIVDGKEIDELKNNLGFRWYSFDPNKGFSLNGEPLKIKGTNRHQDYKSLGAALSRSEHERDLKIIKEMGCNFLRLAHYPQDPDVLDLADELGLLIWEEVPVVNCMTIHPRFYDNSVRMIKEMIGQHYNHPSVIMWGSMNEIFLNNPIRGKNREDEFEKYGQEVARFAKKFDSVIRAEDPSRYTTMAVHKSERYKHFGVDDIPQVLGINRYHGWYWDVFSDLSKQLNILHKEDPNHVFLLSEYGAGADIRLNSSTPKTFDFTGQYQRLFHESHLQQINELPYLSGGAIWNQFDFSNPHTGGSDPHVNQKGVFTWDRKPKDVYYFYKANWNSEPMIYIAEKNWPIRATVAAKESYEITVYSNLLEVDLYVNGKRLKTKTPNEIKKLSWNTNLKPGSNTIRAVGKANGELLEDQFEIVLVRPEKTNGFQLRINVGSNAQYLDKDKNPWVQDTEFNGVYGYITGAPTQSKRSDVIRGTKDAPIYYSYLKNIEKYKVKVPNGRYRVKLHFIEFRKKETGKRVFDLSINNETVLDNFDILAVQGMQYVQVQEFELEVETNEILLDFGTVKDKPILSGLEIIQIK